MKKYQFRLQRVLEVKETIQELRQRELGESVQVLEQEKSAMEHLNKQMASTQNGLRNVVKKRCRPTELRLYYDYTAFVRGNMDVQEQKIQDANKDVLRRNILLVKAYKDREVIARFKERRKKEFMDDYLKEEQSVIDEISSSNFFKDKELIPVQMNG